MRSHDAQGRTGRGRAVAALSAAIVLLSAAPALGQVNLDSPGISASATGTALHIDALQSGDMRVADVEIAFSGASFNSGGLSNALLNEVQREFSPALADKLAYARGAAVEIGLGVTPQDPNQMIIAGLAEHDAPGTGERVTEEGGPLDAAPLAWASFFRGTALADFPADVTTALCPPAGPTSDGLARVVDLQLLDAAGGPEQENEGLVAPLVATSAPDPHRAVIQSHSTTELVPQGVGGNLAMVSEVRQTYAPVTFFTGTPNQFTIEVLGEWVLRATATGSAGGAEIHYGPADASPQTIVVRVIQPDGTENALTTQDFFEDEGFVVEIPDVANVVVGEDPRAIGGDATSEPLTDPTGIAAASAVDVVRVQLFPGDEQHAADLRIGHMEVLAEVPTGGVTCPDVTAVSFFDTDVLGGVTGQPPDEVPRAAAAAEAAPVTEVLGAQGELPRSGAPILRLAVVGAALTFAGAAMIVRARRLF